MGNCVQHVFHKNAQDDNMRCVYNSQETLKGQRKLHGEKKTSQKLKFKTCTLSNHS